MTKLVNHIIPLAILSAVPFAMASEPFEVFPADINLKFQRDRQSIVCKTTEANGVNRNVTAEAKVTFADPTKAKFENGFVLPLADGDTKMRVEFNGQSVEIPVKVEAVKEDPAISFRNDVMPVFMRNGCNSGGCHGASRGKDGFRLSLFGYNPDGDYNNITREQIGRRINLALPEASMLLTKCTGEAPHTGGKLFTAESESYSRIKRWLDAGANLEAETAVPTPVSAEILPKSLLLESPGQKFQMTVRAKYSDGTDRDITDMSLFLSSNDGSAKIDGQGLITTGQRGEAFVMARFATFTVGAQVIVIPKGLQYTKPKVDEWNYVDTLVNAKLDKLRITPSGIADDETFLRRVFIDITGTLPNPTDVKNFTASKEPNKRAAMIDALLQRKEFVDLWALKWSEMLQVRTDNNNQGSYKAVLSYYNWIRDQIEKNVPVNEMARQLIAASGSNLDNPAANYYQLETDPLKLAEDTAQAFFGTRIQCAQCHNHPFDRWNMADYRGFVSFFTQVGRKNGEDPRERIIFNSGGGDARHPVTNAVIPPRFLGEDTGDIAGKDRRQVLADWVASPKNPFFSRHIANLVWAQYMGRGIVEPVDDARLSNPPSNPELMDGLAAKLVEYNYDLRKIVRDICNSAAYQRTTRPNETNELDDRNFAKATIRRMRAEVMLDCITQVTETKDKFRGLPLGARSVEIADGKTTNYFLTTFGRADRETICAREQVGPTLSQALHMLNGDTVEGKIQQGGVVQKLMKSNMTPREIATDLFLRTFNRMPTEQELRKLEDHWGVTEEQPKVFTDIFWALLNSKEFMFNH
ncbi:MAG: hypothetical protein RL088_2379 [Verrucomicrobiota bacterium]|jgi:hypothetical protein